MSDIDNRKIQLSKEYFERTLDGFKNNTISFHHQVKTPRHNAAFEAKRQQAERTQAGYFFMFGKQIFDAYPEQHAMVEDYMARALKLSDEIGERGQELKKNSVVLLGLMQNQGYAFTLPETKTWAAANNNPQP